jgi:DNA-binding transcriptional LysR family regulator
VVDALWFEHEEIMDLIGALRAFVRVTETGSFSAVARETNASQSAVTRQIAQLEQHFQVRLFHRTTRHLSPTDDGNALLHLAQHLLDATDEMEAALGRQSGEPRGLVRLGTSVAGGLFLSTRLPVLLARHPGLSVKLIMSDRHTDMIEERLDLAFRNGEIADVSLVARRVGMLGRAVVAAPIYLDGRARRIARRSGGPRVPHPRRDAGSRVWRFTGRDGPVSVKVSGAFRPATARPYAALRAQAMASLCSEIQLIDDLAPDVCFGFWKITGRSACAHIVYPSRRNLALRTRGDGF